MKKIFLLLCFICFTVSLSAQEMEQNADAKTPEVKSSDFFNFNIGVVPNFDGNTSLGGDASFRYFGWLTAGVRFEKSSVGRALYNKETDIRKVTLIETQVIRFNALGIEIPFKDEGWFQWRIKPGVNGQYIYQRVTFNLVQRVKDRYQYENSNMESMEVNTDLESWMNFGGKVKFYLGGSYVPVDYHKGSGLGYDSLAVSQQVGPLKNVVYTGSTGDYEFNTQSKLLFWDARFELAFMKLIYDTDIYLGGKMQYFKSEFDAERSTVENAVLVIDKKTISQKKTDISGSLGIQLSFIDMGSSKPVLTFNYTRSTYLDINKKTQSENIYGVGITFRKDNK